MTDIQQIQARWLRTCESFAQATPREWSANDERTYRLGLELIDEVVAAFTPAEPQKMLASDVEHGKSELFRRLLAQGALIDQLKSDARIYDRCPACGRDTLVISNNHLLCTWVGGRTEKGCPDPGAARKALETSLAAHSAPAEPQTPEPEDADRTGHPVPPGRGWMGEVQPAAPQTPEKAAFLGGEGWRFDFEDENTADALAAYRQSKKGSQ